MLNERDRAAISEALRDRPTWWTLAGRLASADEDALKMIGIAFALSGEGDVPPPGALDRLPTEVWTMWIAAAEASDDPILVGRLEDLLYIRGESPRHVHGGRAAAALRELAALDTWEGLDRSDRLSRAIQILLELNDREGLSQALREAIALADDLLGSQPYPGPPLRLIETMVHLKADRRPTGLGEVLDYAAKRYEGTHAEDDALSMAERVSSSGERRQEIQKRHIAARRAAFAKLEGLAKASAIQRTIELAKRYGLHDVASELLLALQELPVDPEDFTTFGSETSLPTEELRAEVARVAGEGAANGRDAIRRVGSYGPLTGTIAEIDRELDAQNAEFPFQALLGRTIMSPDSSVPVFIANEPENRRRHDRATRRSLGVQFGVNALIAGMLDAVETVHGRPPHEDLATYFTTALISVSRAERFARALELYWDELYDESAHILVPRLEAALRDLACDSGVTIWKPAGEGTYGGVISLNAVMARLRELTNDDPWFCTIEAILVDPLAMNLRNSIAHGLGGQVDRAGAAALLHVACFLASLERTR